MLVNASTQVGIDVLRKAVQTNQKQINNLLNIEQNAQYKIQIQSQKDDSTPKSNTIGSLFNKKV